MGLWTRFFSSKDGHGGQRGGPETEERHATFRPVKEHTSARRVAMSSRHQATLGSGNLIEAINVPPGEDLNEWLACNTVDFFNEISLLYGLCQKDSKRYTEPGTGFPNGFEYRWAVEKGKKPARVAGPEYVELAFMSVEKTIEDENVFPTVESDNFPIDFIGRIHEMYKRLFRVFAIMYHCHFTVIEDMDAVAHLNTCFKHFVFFCLEFDLISDLEMTVLNGPCDRLKQDFKRAKQRSFSGTRPTSSRRSLLNSTTKSSMRKKSHSHR